MVDLQTSIETKLVIKEIELQAEAKRKIDEITRLRLGIAPGFAPSKSQLATTAAAMGAAGMGKGAAGLAGTMSGLIGAVGSLATVIKVAIDNSKIVNTVMSTIGKALGLLVDLILLPFLPIIVWVLIRLFVAIMWFGKLWKASVDPLVETLGKFFKKENEGGVIPNEPPTSPFDLGWMTRFMGNIDKMLDDMLVGFVKWGFDTLNAIAPVIGKGLNDLATNIGTWLMTLTTDIGESLMSFAGELLNWLTDSFWTPILTGLTKIENGFKSLINNIIDLLNKIPGVNISKIPLVHIPETVDVGGVAYPEPFISTPGGASSSSSTNERPANNNFPGTSNMTVQIYGSYQNDEDLYKKFVDKLRRDQWRQNV